MGGILAIIIEREARRVLNIFNIQFSFPVQLSLMPDSIVVGREITIISIYIPRCIYHSSLAEQIMRNKLNAPTWSRSVGDHPRPGRREVSGLMTECHYGPAVTGLGLT